MIEADPSLGRREALLTQLTGAPQMDGVASRACPVALAVSASRNPECNAPLADVYLQRLQRAEGGTDAIVS
jgi:hypothetical protein